MTTSAEHAPVTAREQSRRITAARPFYAVATVLAAIGTAIGWTLAKVCVSVAAAFFALAWLAGLLYGAVIVGFQAGAGLPPRGAGQPPAEAPPGR